MVLADLARLFLSLVVCFSQISDCQNPPNYETYNQMGSFEFDAFRDLHDLHRKPFDGDNTFIHEVVCSIRHQFQVFSRVF